jgi:effector-binding domain-containing protein
VNAENARDHAALVNRIGPCVGLHHISEKVRTEKDKMTYSITKKELSPQPVLVVRRRVKRSEIASTIAEVLPRVFLYAQQKGIALAGSPFTRYVEVGAGMLTIEPGMRVAASGQTPVSIDLAWTQTSGEGEVVSDTLPGGPVAATMHAGPYDKLPDAYRD